VLYVAGSSRFSSARPCAAKALTCADKNLDRFMLKVDARAELGRATFVAQAIFSPDGQNAAPQRIS